MKKNCLTLLYILVIMILPACSRDNDPAVKAEAAADNIIKESGSPVEAAESEPRPDAGRLRSKISDPEGRDFLLYHETTGLEFYPEDFEIGELQNLNEDDEQTALVIEAALGFLSSIVDAEPDFDMVTAEKREFVKRNIEYGLEKVDVEGFRLGVINMTAEPRRAAIRLEADGGYAEGTMYFIKESGWKIFDFHLDFSDMINKEEADNEPWSPSVM